MILNIGLVTALQSGSSSAVTLNVITPRGAADRRVVKFPSASVVSGVLTGIHFLPTFFSIRSAAPAVRGRRYPLNAICKTLFAVAGALRINKLFTVTRVCALIPSARSHVASEWSRIYVDLPMMIYLEIFPSVPVVTVESVRHVASPGDIPSMRTETPARGV